MGVEKSYVSRGVKIGRGEAACDEQLLSVSCVLLCSTAGGSQTGEVESSSHRAAEQTRLRQGSRYGEETLGDIFGRASILFL